MSMKQELIDMLHKLITAIENQDDDLEVSVMIIQRQNNEYVSDIHEYK